MAEQVPGQTTELGDKTGERERKIPSFTEATREAQESRTRELHERTGTKPAGEEQPSKKPEGGTEEPYDGRAEWEKLPENLRSWATKTIYDGYNAALEQNYGDVIPLLAEINKNPNLRATLAEAARDPELRDLLADPIARDRIKKLSNKELGEFLFGAGVEAFEKYPTSGARADDRDPRDARIDELTQRFEQTENRRERETYVTSRAREVGALRNEFANLTDDQLAHVVTLSEERFEAAANRAGVKTRDERGVMLPDWAGEAVRKGVKPPSYRDYAAQYSEVIGRGAPPAAPAPGTTPAGEPGAKSPQAPRTNVEGLEARRAAGVTAMRELRSKHPGFTQRRNR